jgi:hypothetical protein
MASLKSIENEEQNNNRGKFSYMATAKLSGVSNQDFDLIDQAEMFCVSKATKSNGLIDVTYKPRKTKEILHEISRLTNPN